MLRVRPSMPLQQFSAPSPRGFLCRPILLRVFRYRTQPVTYAKERHSVSSQLGVLRCRTITLLVNAPNEPVCQIP